MLQYSEFNNEKNYQTSAAPTNKHNKTIKKPAAELSALYNKIHKTEKPEKPENSLLNTNEEIENKLSDFKPLPAPQISSLVQQQQQPEVSIEEKIKNYTDTYYSTVPYNNTTTNPDKTLNEQLLNKLNYIINLLEEQKDERTNYITEELILYTFLGIFIIFIIDSFARASKYIR